MATKKASKKSQKKSDKKNEGQDKKRASKKSGNRNSAASSKSSKKASAKGGTRKAAAQKSGSSNGKKAAKASARVREMSAPADQLIGNCIGSGTAGTLIERAVIAVGGISPSAFDIDKKFEQMGVISANQCTQVRQRVLNAVRAFPCTINDGAVTCAPGDKARAMRDAVVANAGSPQ